jgi:YVTN family beta-propeller protein
MGSPPRRRWLHAAIVVATIVTQAACTFPGSGRTHGRAASTVGAPRTTSLPAAGITTNPAAKTLLPGMPAPLDPNDLYAADRPNALSDKVKNHLYRVYVPNNQADTLSVIDPITYKVLETVRVPRSPEHVVPSWDLSTLLVNSDTAPGEALTPIDPTTGKVGTPVPVDDPYNLYFTPDGRYAMVMAELRRQIHFIDPKTFEQRDTLNVDCEGINHADFSPDGRYFIASCEFSGDLLKIDTVKHQIIGKIHLPSEGSMPQDVKIAPDGRTWYVADMHANGVWVLDGDAFTTPTLLPTGAGAHGLYVSRDSRHMYISNRGEGSVSLLEFATGKLVAKWQIPGGGSPDMGGLSPDGKVLWLSGRYHGEVYAIDTTDGHLIARIPTGAAPHGLCVWPQPGRYSLGHTGILR